VCGGVEGHARGVSEQPLTPAPKTRAVAEAASQPVSSPVRTLLIAKDMTK
jgi:hypothetical protein